MKKTTAQNQIADWNKNNPIGTSVEIRLDSGQIKLTRTRSKAALLGGHSAVIWLEDISGCYQLSRVTPKASVS